MPLCDGLADITPGDYVALVRLPLKKKKKNSRFFCIVN